MIDIRIFGVPERIYNIQKNKNILGVDDSKVFIDHLHSGVIPTAKKAWLYHTDKPFVMVLQDDIELCDGFLEICNRMTKAMPTSIISLFPYQFQKYEVLRWSGGIPSESPYVTTNVISGCGVIMPAEYVEPCIASWKPDTSCDDTSIYEWAIANDITVITTLPATLQHIGDRSVIYGGKAVRRTDFYRQTPEANWDNSYYTTWSNLIRS